ncbi:MAG TPA: type III-A CRISPR-associated protein Csm2 [Bacteroidales bacterium]|nr:type III-A CRISPR-associated protein Csm2 [Bacteroidales bacterium]
MSKIQEDFFKETYPYLLRMNEKDTPAGKVIDNIKLFVERTGRAITTSQLRNIYSKILSIKEDNLTALQLIRPKLAYIAARQQRGESKELVMFFDEIISLVKTSEELKSFKTFFESVIAYHKFYHPEKN